MSEIMTIASLPGEAGYMDYGRLTRAEIIQQTRDFAKRQKEHAEAILNAPDKAFYVRVVRGKYIQHLIEVL
jgi:hypothetical protein